ncbi:hypothetical protein [Pseudomonas aeruginosa]|uniref:hypothetical protein n=1 Tax=Pseudomonas aeruginosa TaxID=287 RepID=UPI0010167A47|nr:hypothetical protein [Pseudomonas aeruginosa]
MEVNQIVLFELDVAIPAQQFRIEYTLVEKGGLPVVPEFLLRLLKISALMPAEIAKYFGFSAKELSVAMIPFIKNGEIRIRPDGKAELTEIGLRLFSESHETPVVKRKEERQQTFTFDLLAFSYLGRSLKSVESKRTLELQVATEKLTESCRFAVEAFMSQLYDIHRLGHLGGQQQERLPPELYKVAETQKVREGWEILVERAAIDANARQVRFIAIEGLRENEAYLRQRTEQLSRQTTIENFELVLRLVEILGDTDSYDFLRSDGLDIQKLNATAASAINSDTRIFGSLQLQENWNKVFSLLEKHRKELKRTYQGEPLKLTWLAPASHELWGKSARHGEICSAFNELSNAKAQSGKGDKLFEVKVLIPLSSDRDMQGIKRARSDCSEAKNLLYGFVESEVLSPIEAIILEGRLAVVLYHLVIPEISQVPIPFGFVTENASRVDMLGIFISSTLEEYVAGNTPRFLGPIEKSKGNR